MKKIYFALMAALAATGLADASPITPDEALGRIPTDLRKMQSKNGETMRLVASGQYESHPSYYVFSDGESTMFLSADDVAAPLLGYADTPYDPANVPSELKWWLSEYGRQIVWANAEPARAEKYRASADATKVKATDQRRAAVTKIEPLISTKWDQLTPYNDLCPAIGNELTLTGCVATATAQVLYYHRPSSPMKSKNTYYWTAGKRYNSTDFTGITFDWDNMLDVYDEGKYTPEQGKAVAELMSAVGLAVQMQYDTYANGGSGAFSSNITCAMIENFGMDSKTYYRNSTDDNAWHYMIQNQLADGNPVIYGGSGEMGGHSFVCDGYEYKNSKHFYHINWGWSGMGDGYYLLDALQPAEPGSGAVDTDFNQNQDIVLVSPAGKTELDGEITTSPILSLDGFTPGEKYTLEYKIYNTFNTEKTANFGAFLYSYDTGDDFLIDVRMTKVPAHSSVAVKVEGTLDENIPAGEYILTFMDSDLNDLTGTYSYVKVNGQGAPEAIIMREGKSDLKVVEINTDGPFIAGQQSTVDVLLANPTNRELTVTPRVALTTDGSNREYTGYFLGSKANSVTVAPYSTVDLTFSGIVTDKVCTSDIYVDCGLAVCLQQEENVTIINRQENVTVWYSDYANEEGLYPIVTDVEIEGDFVTGNTVKATVTIASPDEYYDYDTDLEMWLLPTTGTSTHSYSENISLTIPAGEVIEQVFTLPISAVDTAGKYNLSLFESYLDEYYFFGDHVYDVDVVSKPNIEVTGFRSVAADESALKLSVEVNVAEASDALLVAPVYNNGDECVGIAVWTPQLAAGTQSISNVINVEGLAAGEHYTAELRQILSGSLCRLLATTDFIADKGSGIVSPSADGSEIKPVYFTLDGIRVEGDSLTKGIYIKVEGHEVSRIMVR